MTKRDDDIDELQRELKELREKKIRNDGFKDGVIWSGKHFFLVCSTLWGIVYFGVSVAGDFFYNNVPPIKQIVDILNGVK